MAIKRRDGLESLGDFGPVEAGSFSERQWDWLQTVPVKSDQLRGLVIGDSPGVGGGRRRAVIILDLDDFCDWFVAAEPPE